MLDQNGIGRMRKAEDLDTLLSQLGVDPSAAAADQVRPAVKAPEPAPSRKHTLDLNHQAMAGLPAVPANQRPFAKPLQPVDDPAVSTAQRLQAAAAEATVGQAIAPVWRPEDQDAPPTPPAAAGDVGNYLLRSGLITAQQLQAAQQVAAQTPGKSIADILIEQGVDEAKVLRGVAERSGLPFETIDLAKGLEGGFDGKLLQRLTIDFCKQHMVLPLRMESSRAVVGFVHPHQAFLVDEIKRRLGVPAVRCVVVTGFDIRGALEISGDKAGSSAIDVNDILRDVDDGDVQVEKKEHQEVDLEKEAGESPVIRYVNFIIQKAVEEGASDIHIEPSEKKIKVRFRIDGEMFEMMNPPPSMSAAITSRLKIMANLDISERRLPQDGRIRCTVQSRKLDLRMSTLPVTGGEKVVMRILDTRSINVKLEDLGFDESILRTWKGLCDAPHGIVLVTGPTGSGKTTTLYSSIRQLDKNGMNISTVEDPVEYHLDGINQTQTHDRIGMTFAKALKALLRQDPDVILVGEIRDLETAVTAVQAALTGHLVLSTLHTNDAPGSVTRLVNIGVEPFLVSAALNGVLAQRLLRRLCSNCKKQVPPSQEMQEFLHLQGLPTNTMWTHAGCKEKCRNTGYSGRLGIYELLTVDDQLRDVIVRNPNVAELRRLCIERGMVSLRQDGLKKASRGITSVEEVLRITEAAA